MSEFAEYNRLLLEVKMKALEVLQRLLSTAEDPKEKRRIAEAILKVARPSRGVVVTPAQGAGAAVSLPSRASPALSPHALGTLNLDSRELDVAPAGVGFSVIGEPLLATPIPLGPSDASAAHGGPAGPRPLPFPLGPPVA
ncbi:MAG TPA: hypothetical protein VFF65_13120 [Phycisphaerales bacterium]|nr:hypothetical protein [Phycisphaerales bacterium]